MWVRQDDSVTSHPKIAMAGPDAFILWSGALCYANRHATDGYIADHVLPLLFPAFGWSDSKCRPLAARLVKAGLWHPVEGGGWTIHDYGDYQDEAMRANVARRRDAAKLRKRAQRERDDHGDRRGKSPSHAVTERDESHAVTPSSQPPVPSRPDPSRSLSNESGRTPPTLLGVEAVEAALRRGYAKRFEREAGDAWMTHARDTAHIQRAAAWCRTQPDVSEAIERFLDGAFRHEPWRKWRWKWEYLAEDPGHTASRSPAPVGSMAGHESAEAAAAARVAAIPTWTAEELAKTAAEGGW